MEIKMKNEEIIQCIEVMKPLKEKGKLGYAIARNLRKMQDATADYKQFRDEAIRKHGTKIKLQDGSDGYAIVSQESKDAFESEIEELAVIEETIDILQVSEEQFYSGDITSDKMAMLFWMVEDPGQEAGGK